MQEGTKQLMVGWVRKGSLLVELGNKLSHSSYAPTTAVKHNMSWKMSSHPMQQAGYKAFIKGWEKLPTLQCHQLFNSTPQIWLIPKYISSHISLPYFITHVDFQISFLMHLISTHKTHWLGWPTHPSLSRTFVVWALKLMHPEKTPLSQTNQDS